MAKVRSIRSFTKSDVELVLDLENSPRSMMDIYDLWMTSESTRNQPCGLLLISMDNEEDRVREWLCPKITKKVLRIPRTRNSYCTKHHKSGNIDDWENFKRLRNASKSAMRKAKTEQFEGICLENLFRTCKQLNKVFWLKQYAKSFRVGVSFRAIKLCLNLNWLLVAY